MAVIYGTNGSDVRNGTESNDILYGWSPTGDTTTDTGNDFLDGLGGSDTIFGGGGNDGIIDGAREDLTTSDSLNGEAGNDKFESYGGADAIDGGAGLDNLFLYRQHAVADITFTFVSADQTATFVGDGSTVVGVEGFLIMTGSGADVIDVSKADAGGNSLYGGGGADILSAGKGNDNLFGEIGNDTLVAGDGNDELYGGDGDDTLYGQNGNDLLVDNDSQTSNDADTLSGGAGNDSILSVGGKDTIDGGLDLDELTLNRATLTQNLSFVMASAATVTTLVGDGTTVVNVEKFKITTGSGNDTVKLAGGNGTIDGGAGNDTLQGGSGYNVLYGGKGTDTLALGDGGGIGDGGEGNDAVTGGAGIDMLYGRQGNNSLDGGAGNDKIYSDGGIDTIDGGTGIDFAKFDWSAAAGGLTFNMTSTSAVTTVVGNGTTVTKIEMFDIFSGEGDDTITTGDFDDVVYGNGGNDTIRGGAGKNLLNGGDGNDTLYNSSGNDRLEGGNGNDTFYLGAGRALAGGGNGNDVYIFLEENQDHFLFEGQSDGIDEIRASFSYILPSFSQGVIENLTLTGHAAIDGRGNIAANTIKGNDASNRLKGESGNDVLDGGAGADTLIGDKGDDIFYVDDIGDRVFEGKGRGKDTVHTSVSFSIVGQEIETLLLSGTANIDGTGNSGANTITGNLGDNVLNGGANKDVMAGSAGNDTYVVDNAGDRVLERAGDGIDTVNAYVSFSLAGQEIENLVLAGTNATDATGNSGANTITGNTSANVIDGSGGADAMRGLGGNDTYIVDHLGDRVFESPDKGTDLVRASVSFSLAGQAIEMLTLTGIAAINGTGNSGANTITGNDSANIIDGGANADTMTGLGGNDTYIVDNRNDRVFEAKGGGADTVRASVSYALVGQDIESLVLTGTAAINATGNSGANRLTGNTAANVIDGGLNADVLTGGLGADVFVFSTTPGGSNVDRITDFSVTDDSIRLDKSIFSALSPGELSATAFKEISTGTVDANDRVLYNKATGGLFYDADGSGSGAAIRLATLENMANIAASDFFIS